MRVHSVVGVDLQRIGDEAMLLHPTGTRALALSATALAVWARCSEVADVDDIVQELAHDYGTTPERIKADVHTTIHQLSDLGFIQIT